MNIFCQRNTIIAVIVTTATAVSVTSGAQSQNAPVMVTSNAGMLRIVAPDHRELSLVIERQTPTLRPNMLQWSSNGRLLIGPIGGVGYSPPSFATNEAFVAEPCQDVTIERSENNVGLSDNFFIRRVPEGTIDFVEDTDPTNELVDTWTGRVMTGSGSEPGPTTDSPVSMWTNSIH